MGLGSGKIVLFAVFALLNLLAPESYLKVEIFIIYLNSLATAGISNHLLNHLRSTPTHFTSPRSLSHYIMAPFDSIVGLSKTPPESVVTDLQEDHKPDIGAIPFPTSVPWPGNIFIIRSVPCGRVIALLGGRVVLAPIGGHGAIHWDCVESEGWLGFRNLVTDRYLGYNEEGRMHCESDQHAEWEKFCVRMRPEGGYVLLMINDEKLSQVGVKVDQEVEKLCRLGEGAPGGKRWEFIKC